MSKPTTIYGREKMGNSRIIGFQATELCQISISFFQKVSSLNETARSLIHHFYCKASPLLLSKKTHENYKINPVRKHRFSLRMHERQPKER